MDTGTYAKILTKDTFQQYMRALADSPHMAACDDMEPMVTIRHKDRDDYYDWQLWRDSSEESMFSGTCSDTDDPTQIRLYDRFFNGEYLIELAIDGDYVDPAHYLMSKL